MKHLLQWLRNRLRRREIRAWLEHNDAEAITAQALWCLNRHARGRRGLERYNIYKLKQALIRYWYKGGRTRKVTLQRQDMECWSCMGDGEWAPDEECWKCAGTGIYRTHWLYRFIMELGNQIYVWHQPKSLVDYPVRLTSQPITHYVATGGGREGSLDYDRRRFLLDVLDVYLEMVTGANWLSDGDLVDALRLDWIHFVWEHDLDLKARRLTRPWRRLKRMAGIVGHLYRKGALPEPERADPERDIPF